MFTPLSESKIRHVLAQAGLPNNGKISRVPAGFSNDVYDIADRHILKAAKSKADGELLKREVYLCNLFMGKIPAPEVVYSGESNDSEARPFIIYKKIAGDNLYLKWHALSRSTKRQIVKAICSYLKIVNNTPYGDYIQRFNSAAPMNWHDKIITSLNSRLAVVTERKLIATDLISKAEAYVGANAHVLHEERMALTYYDPHFDNFIFYEDQISGMLDFERTEITSIDYVLDLVQRMVKFPKKYASLEAEKFIRAADYSELLNWYQESYPELFEFKDIEIRLAVYAIDHALHDIILFPDATQPHKELALYLA